MMHELVLEREMAFPKMKSKGELSQTEFSADDLKNCFQKRLLELKQNETAGLIEELQVGSLDGYENSGEALPDLRDIPSSRKKPFIEVIEESSLREKDISAESSAGKGDVVNESPLPKNGRLATQDDTVKYAYSITQKQQGSQHYILFESSQLTKNINVSYLTLNSACRNIIILLMSIEKGSWDKITY